jgi:dTDP-4-dehydrorhamnose reductase
LGGSGQLGTELQRYASARWDIAAPDREKLDVSDLARLAASVAELQPDLVVNATAFHVVDFCETHFSEALATNAVAVSILAKACERLGARFVTISTDYAFDGMTRFPYKETDPAKPIQCYGISKVAGEFTALAAHPAGAYVVRTCGLYGHAESRQKSGNFVLNRLRDGTGRAELEVGCDLVCTPTAAADLAVAIVDLLGSDAPAGLYHLTNEGSCDWATFTTEIFRLAGLPTRVVRVDRGGVYGPAQRPPFSVLDCSKARAHTVNLGSWQEALAAYIRSVCH